MKSITVQPFYGTKDDKMDILDLHGDPVDGMDNFQKIMPSEVRKKIIERANVKGTSELIEIINSLLRYQSMLDEYPSVENVTGKGAMQIKRATGTYPKGSCAICGYKPAKYTNGEQDLCSKHKRYKT